MNNEADTFIQLENVGKRFNFTWIFRNIHLKIIKGSAIALVGSNGSGKSTLMQCIAGFQTISEGKCLMQFNGRVVEETSKYQHVAISAPYQELIDEFTFFEMLQFHFSIQKKLAQITIEDILVLSELDKMKDKKLLYFSSGMRQRVKLVMALFSDVEFLFLDEPCSNFDRNAINWYQRLINDYKMNRTLLICSNHQDNEIKFCDQVFDLQQ